MNLTCVAGLTVLVVASVSLSPLEAASYGPFKLQDFQTRAAFELALNRQ